MKSIDIKGSLREEVGKRSTKQLRQKGHVPCVLYRKGEVTHFEAPEVNFKDLVYSPDVYLVNLDIDGEKYQGVMQDIHFHPVTDNIQHIDFYQVVEKHPFWMRIPVRFNGQPRGVQEGGKLIIKKRKVIIQALPRHMPDEINLDISDLGIGDSIRLADLGYENLELLDDPNSVLVIVKSPRGGSAFATEEELAAAEEGEEGEESAEEGAAEGTEEGAEEGAEEGSEEKEE